MANSGKPTDRGPAAGGGIEPRGDSVDVAAVDVVVVGAGVSGSACAGLLARGGLRVVLLGSSLDTLAMPTGGPCLELPAPTGESGSVAGEILAWFTRFPTDLAVAWLGEARILPDGSHASDCGDTWALSEQTANQVEPAAWRGCLLDRRAVSVRYKAWVESAPGVELRQGLATDLRLPAAGSVEVETAFGEVIRARVAVLAPGLGLHGRHRIGDREFPGSRMGEIPADRLGDALGALDLQLEAAQRVVGERFQFSGGRVPVGDRGLRLERLEWLGRSGLMLDADAEPPRKLARAIEAAPAVPVPGGEPPSRCGSAPPSPYADRRSGEALILRDGPGARSATSQADPGVSHGLQRQRAQGGEVEYDSAPAPGSGEAHLDLEGCPAALVPDGIATGEFYLPLALSPRFESVRAALERDGVLQVSRPGYTSLGAVLSSSASARLESFGGRVYACGQFAGARSYAESLVSAQETAASLLDRLGG